MKGWKYIMIWSNSHLFDYIFVSYLNINIVVSYKIGYKFKRNWFNLQFGLHNYSLLTST